jgi:hypothetical protein
VLYVFVFICSRVPGATDAKVRVPLKQQKPSKSLCTPARSSGLSSGPATTVHETYDGGESMSDYGSDSGTNICSIGILVLISVDHDRLEGVWVLRLSTIS